MKIVYLGILGIAACLASCKFGKPNNNKPDVYTDTLTYHFNQIKSRATDCGSKPDSGCTVAKFKYPVFDNQPLLNDSIYTSVATLLDRIKGAAGIQRLVGQFLVDYQDFKKEHPDFKGNFELNSEANIVRQDSSLTTIEITGYQFVGGAHGTSMTRYINFNTQSRKVLHLSDILKPGSETALTKAAEKIFRKNENLDPNASLATNYFFKGGKFTLNTNFLITPVGLHFLYNENEIKPHAAGETTLVIPYKDILSLLQPNTVVARYTNNAGI